MDGRTDASWLLLYFGMDFRIFKGEGKTARGRMEERAGVREKVEGGRG